MRGQVEGSEVNRGAIRVAVGAAALLLAVGAPPLAEAQDGFGGWSNDALVRAQAAEGYVPASNAFHIEGLLAEHHFPARDQRCGSRFCVLGAMGHGQHRPSGEQSAYLVVEPVSGFDPETTERPLLDLVLVVDRSGSMQGWKLDAAKEAAHVLIDALHAEDRLSIVTFDEQAEVHAPSQPVDDRAQLHEAVEGIEIRGGTNVYDGLSLGFAQVRAAEVDALPRLRRVLMLTDERPNVGATEGGDFLELIGAHAAQSIGLTVVGVGLDLGAELANTMAQVEGAASYYLWRPEDAAALFSDLRRFVMPVALGLQVRVEPGPGLRVAEVFGVPGDRVSLHPDGSATFRASTVFFDPIRRGAVVRLAPTVPGSDAALHADATIRFSYRLPESGQRYAGERRTQHRSLRPDAIADFPSHGAYLAYALVSYGERLRVGLTAWEAGQQDRAIAQLQEARRYLRFDRQVLEDAQLDDERDTVDRILRTMRAGKR